MIRSRPIDKARKEGVTAVQARRIERVDDGERYYRYQERINSKQGRGRGGGER